MTAELINRAQAGPPGFACRRRCRTACSPSPSRCFSSWGPLLAHNQPAARPLADPANLGYLLLAMGSLPLLVRRCWPVWVFITTAAVSLVYYAAGYPTGRSGPACSSPPTSSPLTATGTGR